MSARISPGRSRDTPQKNFLSEATPADSREKIVGIRVLQFAGASLWKSRARKPWSGTGKGTPKNFCDKDFAELSGELSGAICLKTLVLVGRALELFRKFFRTVRAFFGFGVLFWSPDMKCKLRTETLEFSRLKVPNSRFALHGLAPPSFTVCASFLPAIHGLCAFFRLLLTPSRQPLLRHPLSSRFALHGLCAFEKRCLRGNFVLRRCHPLQKHSVWAAFLPFLTWGRISSRLHQKSEGKFYEFDFQGFGGDLLVDFLCLLSGEKNVEQNSRTIRSALGISQSKCTLQRWRQSEMPPPCERSAIPIKKLPCILPRIQSC